MTLSDERVIDELNRNFVSGWTNIKGKTEYAGSSNTHLPDYHAQCVNNSSGHHNVQMFFLTPNGRLLHCLPGFWNAKHFLYETEFAVDLARVYYTRGISPAQRNELYINRHLEHAIEHDAHLRGSSDLQGFDKQKMAKKEDSDFRRDKGFIVGSLKTADQVMHERMAELPFVPFESFDVKKYIDMGLKRYKYDLGIPESERMAKKSRAKEKEPDGGKSE